MAAPVLVEHIEPGATTDDFLALKLDCGSTIRARTVLLAAGVHWRKLTAPGAERFEEAGIHYACTTVEAILYDNNDVAVVGAGNSAGQAAMFLAECCRDRTVHLLIRKRLGPGMSAYLVNRIRSARNIVIHEGVEIASVDGNRRLESITLREFNPDIPEGAASEQQILRETLPVGAVFVFIGAELGCTWLPETLARDSLGYILTGVDALRLRPLAAQGSRAMPAGNHRPAHILAAGDIRRRFHQARRFCRWRRLTGRHLRSQINRDTQLILI